MKEYRQIVERWLQGSASVLMTLVRVQGSSYRQSGARLLACKDGTYEGSISGGCLETDLLRKAAWLVREGAVIQRYSTSFEDADEMPFGLGCGGVLDVLVEDVETAECEALLRAMKSTFSGEERLVATFLPTSVRKMMRAVFRPGGELIFASSRMSSEFVSQARKRCLHNQDEDFDGMFIERLLPPQRLFIFGAGDDAKPLATMACLLGWSVTVVDGRGHLARKMRFPESGVQIVTNPGTAIRQITGLDAAVIMTHSYEQDRNYLVSLLPLQPRYLGLLGSRRRSALLIAEAAARLDRSVSDCCAPISAPAGLNLGGEGPEAIALAIIAEAQACCMGSENERRKLSTENVHHHLASFDPQKYQHSQCGLSTL